MVAVPDAASADFVPPTNPPANLWAVPAYTLTPVTNHPYRVGQALPACWRWGGYGKFVSQPSAPHCLADEVAATNRAHRAEGLPAIVLPRNFRALSPLEQLLVLVDIERVSRGEPPVLGLSASVNGFAQLGALANTDPSLPENSGLTDYGWAANYAGAVSTLDANYEWMYTDGWDGKLTFNYACTGPTAPGCWGHRDNILVNATVLPCYEASCSLVMGAGYVRDGAGDGFNSYTELFVQVSGVIPVLYYTWDEALAAGATA
jgi:hypothetical protein